MSEPLRIRRAGRDDARWIRDCQLAMAHETEALALEPEVALRGVEHVFDEPRLGFYVAAERGAERVGCALVLSEWSDWRAREVWWIHSVYVLPPVRGHGVFRALYQHVEDEARAHGVPYLRLYVERGNQRAQRVYEQLGMSDRHYAMYEKPVSAG
ncbi:MAG: GNAT family N-acetyltransferase [Planctomycetes bacterium]|nr:GNAT family N-acetyltransferase [Planctomycetota bacterium]